MAGVFGFVIALLLVGALLRITRVVPESAAEPLNVIALYVCLPASIFLNAPHLRFERSLLGLVAVPWLLMGASVVLILLLGRALGWARDTKACVLLEMPLGNTSFMGYALVPALATAGALRYAVVYDQFGSFLMLGTYGLFVIGAQSGSGRPSAATMVKRVVTFPPFLALVVGLTVVPEHLPPAVQKPLETVAGSLLPIVGLAVGMQLKLTMRRDHLVPLGVVVVGKLLLLPLGAIGLCALFGMRGEMRAAAILESAMPTMMTTGALLSTAGLAPELAAAIVGYTTVLSMLTLPLWRYLAL
ncbi:MAG: putative malate permease [Labilithrix sp.]|nr:putative malate permease [Labilithrix sp.]